MTWALAVVLLTAHIHIEFQGSPSERDLIAMQGLFWDHGIALTYEVIPTNYGCDLVAADFDDADFDGLTQIVLHCDADSFGRVYKIGSNLSFVRLNINHGIRPDLCVHMHEIGHMLGLRHPPTANKFPPSYVSVMNPWHTSVCTYRSDEWEQIYESTVARTTNQFD